jgi:hypothetical protein
MIFSKTFSNLAMLAFISLICIFYRIQLTDTSDSPVSFALLVALTIMWARVTP